MRKQEELDDWKQRLDTWKQAMCVYAKNVQGQNYPGDEYYLQPETWDDAFKDGLTPEEAVDSDMSYWESE